MAANKKKNSSTDYLTATTCPPAGAGGAKYFSLFFCLDTKEPKNQGCKII